jgi:hypothetical protein
VILGQYDASLRDGHAFPFARQRRLELVDLIP